MIDEPRSHDTEPSLLDRCLARANDEALPIPVGEFGFRMDGFWRAVAPSKPEPGGVPATNQ